MEHGDRSSQKNSRSSLAGSLNQLKGFPFFHLFTIYSCFNNFQYPTLRRCRLPFSTHHNGGFEPALAALAAQVPCFSCKGVDAMREAVGDMGATTKTGQMAGICWNELGFMARRREKRWGNW